MSLNSNFQIAFSAQRIAELTNPQDVDATGLAATRLQKACDLTEAMFKIHVGATYDDTNAMHVASALKCVEIMLLQWIGQRSTEEADRYIKEVLDDVAKVTARNRMLPVTDSVFVPTSRQVDSEVVTPDFDWTKFKDYNQQGPGDAETLP